MSKEVVGVVVDGGATGQLAHRQDAIARACKLLHRAAMEGRASDMAGVVLVGTAKASSGSMAFNGVHILGPLKRSVDRLTDWQRTLLHDSDGGVWSGTCTGDLLDGVVQCADSMVEAMGGGKFGEATIYVFTTMERLRKYNNSNINSDNCEECREIGERLEGEGIEVFFVLPDEDCDSDSISPMGFGECINYRQFDDSFAHPIKRTRPTCLYRGKLSIGQSFQINVKVFNKTQQMAIPRGKWINGGSRSTGHHIKSTDELVDADRMVKAYKYGSDRIPFSLVDQAQLNGGDSEKSLAILGFGLKSQLHRAALLTNVMVIMADEGDNGAFQALLEAMQRQDRVGLARFQRTEKTDVRLLYLFADADRQCMYAVTAPFAEDHRRWTFPGLPTPSEAGVSAMRKLVMSLSSDSHDGTDEYMMVNPCISHLWTAIRHRAINGENADIPAYSVDLLAPMQSRMTDAGIAASVHSSLPITINPLSGGESGGWHRTTSADAMPRFWSSSTAAGKPAPDNHLNNYDADVILAAHNRLVNDTTEDRVGEAMLLLMTRIPQLLYQDSIDADTRREQAVRLLRRLRLTATQHSLSLRYNAFVSELKRRALSASSSSNEDPVTRPFFTVAVCENHLTLISSNEDEESAVTPQEALDFMTL